MFFNKSAKLLEIAQSELLQNKGLLTQANDKLAVISIELQETKNRLALSHLDADQLLKQNESLLTKYASIIDLDKSLQERKDALKESEIDLKNLSDKYMASLSVYTELEKKINLYKDDLEISEYGLYKTKYSFEIPEQYKVELESIYQKQKQMISSGVSVKCYTEWSVGGSLTQGKKMTKLYTKLMLYAFNGECDSLIARVNWNNAIKLEARIRSAFENINKLGDTHNISITSEYLDLKLNELTLNYEYEQKKYEAKEEQRRIREQMREEEKAQKEFERAQREAEEEETRFQKALDKAQQELKAGGDSSMLEELNNRIKLLESNLQDAQSKKERALSMAQMTKVGHIYVISNIGSFGENVIKIGMTRRLDPQDRIRELGDASVPFHFDVHAIIYSENAPQLEYELHQQFKDRSLNKVNPRKEFFRVSLDEIESFVNKHTNAGIVFTKLAEAREYRETLSFIERLNQVKAEVQKPSNFPENIM